MPGICSTGPSDYKMILRFALNDRHILHVILSKAKDLLYPLQFFLSLRGIPEHVFRVVEAALGL